MNQIRGWEWIIILAIILLLFGSKKLPDMARGLGRSARILKAETKGLRDDDASTDSAGDAATKSVAPDAAADAAEAPKSDPQA